MNYDCDEEKDENTTLFFPYCGECVKCDTCGRNKKIQGDRSVLMIL